MKKTFAFLVFTLSFSACMQSAKGPNGVEYKTVAQYNDYIVGRQMEIIKSMKDMVAMISTNKNSAINMLSNVSEKCLKTAKDVEGMPEWKGNTNFRDKAAAMFKYYGTTYSKEFKELIQLAGNPEISETERAGLKDKGEAIDQEEEKINKSFLDAQKEFSDANHLRLEKRETTQ